MKIERGAATLFITSITLILALMVVLGSYKGLFYQIKRANNEVQARQDHWAAEGGLECVYTHAKIDNAVPVSSDVASCKSTLDLNELVIEAGSNQTIAATSGNLTLRKTFSVPTASGTGAVKSTADLLVNGSTAIEPPDPGQLIDDEYQCRAVTVSNYFIAATIENKGVGSTITPPKSGFDNSGGKDCAASHHSSGVAANSGIWQNSSGDYVKSAGLKADFQRESGLNPFKSKFGYKRSEWKKVRDHDDYNFTVIGSETAPISPNGCATEIYDKLEPGRTNQFWIHGDCELTNSTSGKKLSDIVSYQSDHPGTYLFLLVHNGVVGISGAATLEGVMFHFNDGYTPASTQWNDFTAAITGTMNHTPSVFNTLIGTIYSAPAPSAKMATYFQNGSFSFTGGMTFDTQGQMTLFNSALSLKYNSDIENSFPFNQQVKWVEGSWYDH